jgi:dipeptidyl-peptidase-4
MAWLAVLPPAHAEGPDGRDASTTPRHSIERLYSLPRLIGTAPSNLVWSGDGRYLAFLWNDEGRNFRDVWVVDVEDLALTPRRVTRMPHRDLASPSEEPVERVTARERAERDPGVTSVTWHPDGRRLLISFRGDLWLVGNETPPQRLTRTADVETQPAYSPDGTRLAFVRAGDLWTLAADTNDDRPSRTARKRTSIASADGTRLDVEVARFAWSPGGETIAVLEADRRGVALRGIPDYLSSETTLPLIRRAVPGEEPVRQRLGLLDLRAGGPGMRWLTWSQQQPDMLLDFAWSPNGTRIAVDTSDLYAKNRRIFNVDVASGNATDPAVHAALEGRLIARDLDPENETFYFWRIAWSTDSQHLYFLSDRDQDYHVYSVSPSRPGEARRLTRGAWAVAAMHPIDSGLVVVGNRGNAEERQLFRIDSEGGEPVRQSVRPGTHAPVISPDGRYAAVIFSSDDTPPDLFLTALGTLRNERRVTRSPLPAFDNYRWVTPRYVTFPSHVDGTTLHGRLTLPPDFDPDRTYPAILGSVYTDSVRNQWGGRTAHPTWGLDQLLAQEGYLLLNVDMRGSWGRGRAHRRGIRLDYGGMDIEDLESGVRFLSGLGYVDRDRIGIWGSSYGGLMTAMSLFKKPGLYAAGVAGAPATNVWHALTGQMAVMMRPEEQPAAYADSSPFMHARGLEDPLMIIHGMRDRVVLFKDSVTLVQRLLMLGKDIDFVALPDAGHGWDNEGLAQTRFAFRKLVQHFDRHLKRADPPADSRRQNR